MSNESEGGGSRIPDMPVPVPTPGAPQDEIVWTQWERGRRGGGGVPRRPRRGDVSRRRPAARVRQRGGRPAPARGRGPRHPSRGRGLLAGPARGGGGGAQRPAGARRARRIPPRRRRRHPRGRLVPGRTGRPRRRALAVHAADVGRARSRARVRTPRSRRAIRRRGACAACSPTRTGSKRTPPAKPRAAPPGTGASTRTTRPSWRRSPPRPSRIRGSRRSRATSSRRPQGSRSTGSAGSSGTSARRAWWSSSTPAAGDRRTRRSTWCCAWSWDPGCRPSTGRKAGRPGFAPSTPPCCARSPPGPTRGSASRPCGCAASAGRSAATTPPSPPPCGAWGRPVSCGSPTAAVREGTTPPRPFFASRRRGRPADTAAGAPRATFPPAIPAEAADGDARRALDGAIPREIGIPCTPEARIAVGKCPTPPKQAVSSGRSPRGRTSGFVVSAARNRNPGIAARASRRPCGARSRKRTRAQPFRAAFVAPWRCVGAARGKRRTLPSLRQPRGDASARSRGNRRRPRSRPGAAAESARSRRSMPLARAVYYGQPPRSARATLAGAPATGCANTPTSSPNTSAPTRPSRRPRRADDAADRPGTSSRTPMPDGEPNPETGEFCFGTFWGLFNRHLTRWCVSFDGGWRFGRSYLGCVSRRCPAPLRQGVDGADNGSQCLGRAVPWRRIIALGGFVGAGLAVDPTDDPLEHHHVMGMGLRRGPLGQIDDRLGGSEVEANREVAGVSDAGLLRELGEASSGGGRRSVASWGYALVVQTVERPERLRHAGS